MKKSIIFAFVLVISSSLCFAVGAGPSVRSMGMGGTGIATANDITAAYFNPAGLMFGPENFEAQLFGGGATNGLSSIANAISDSSNFVENNLADAFSGNASVAGGLGISVKKIGLSAIAIGNVNFNKPAFDITPPLDITKFKFSFSGQGELDVPLTLGSSISTPGLPIAQLAVGVNLKSISLDLFNTTVKAGQGTSFVGQGAGFGFDIGAQAKVTPLIMVGAVVRNLSASVNMATQTSGVSLDSTGKLQTLSEVDDHKTITPAPQTGIGAGVIIPITGTLVAMDLENYSTYDNGSLTKTTSYTDTHFGVEQGMFFNTVMLRAGYYTYGPTSDTFYTYGLGFNMGPASLGLAAANSVKDCVNSMCMAQMGVAF
jgi:hypothetical protein